MTDCVTEYITNSELFYLEGNSTMTDFQVLFTWKPFKRPIIRKKLSYPYSLCRNDAQLDAA